MELIAELDPPRDPSLLLSMAKRLSSLYNWLDIPDAPLGKPNYSSPVIAAFLAAYNFNVIAHLRTRDVNTIALKTITKTLGSLGVKRLVYLKGDPPQQGSEVNDFTPEQAVLYARTRPEAPEPGLLLSLRKSLNEIEKRIKIPAGFYLVLNYDWISNSQDKLLIELRRMIDDRKIYVYAIVRGKCEDHLNIIKKKINMIKNVTDGILISSPGNPECLYKIGEELKVQI